MKRFNNPILPYLLLLVASLTMTLGCGGSHGAAPDPSSADGKLAAADALTRKAEEGPVRLDVALQPAAPELSDRPTLTVTIDYDAGVTVEKPIFGDAVGDFGIVATEESSQTLEDGREQIRQTLTLEPARRGNLEIDPITVYFTEGQSIKENHVQTGMMPVRVGSVVASKDPSLDGLRASVGPVDLPSSYLLISVLTTIIVTVVAGGIMFALWRRRHVAELAPPATPEEWAQAALDALLASGLARMDVKRFYVELTGIVRHYIEWSFGIRAPEQTTEEFLREISGNGVFTHDESLSLKEFLESADLVKFAGVRPRYDVIEGSVARARAFISLGLKRPAEEIVEAQECANA